jgi:virginiamycin B lyase
MQRRSTIVAALVSSCLCVAVSPAARAADDATAPFLSGMVMSPEGAPIEGVLVSAQGASSSITITVVSDAKGNYVFPRGKVGPGAYTIRIRAAGYDLESPAEVLLKARPATQYVRLKKTKDLAAQLTNAEWMASMPGEPQEKRQLLNCVACHTLERVVRSKYTSEEFLKTILPRMQGYVNQSIPAAPQLRKGERLMEERGDQRVQVYKALGDFLAKVNLSAGKTWSYELKTFPRPRGEATRVVYTEYDLPDKLAQPHDVIIDAKGRAWYSSFGLQKIGRLDPVTGAVKEYDIAISKPDYPTGVLALRGDREGKLWLGNMYQASIARFDPATEQFQYFTPPAKDNLSSTQLNMVSPWNSGVDGKVWSQNNGFAGVHRFDVATGKGETWAPFKDSKEPHNIYDVISDSHNNAYFTDFRQQHIGRIDAKTGELKLYETPTKGSSPRRGSMDSQDRLWFGEYRGHNIGMLDTATGVIKEWKVPTPYSAPYDVTLDKDEHAWTGSMTTDRIARLDTRTGEFVEYLLPRSTNIRRVFVDNTTTPPTFWVGNNHGASIVKLETLAPPGN